MNFGIHLQICCSLKNGKNENEKSCNLEQKATRLLNNEKHVYMKMYRIWLQDGYE